MHNKASIQLFKLAGFKKVGVRREWLRTAEGWQDVLEMQRVLGS